MHHYYFAIASKKFLTEEEPLEEILRERVNHYKTNKKDIDFWFVENPEFFNFKSIKKVINSNDQPMAAIVSTNKTFINWIKLRIGYVFIGKIAESEFITNTLLEDIVKNI
nr:Ycf54 [Porphyropsis coccinea]